MSPPRDILHRLAHLTHWNLCEATSWTDAETGKHFTGAKCVTCGRISAVVDWDDVHCPVCGYYCLGNGGRGCIDKPFLSGRSI
jgi:hypothetical protein